MIVDSVTVGMCMLRLECYCESAAKPIEPMRMNFECDDSVEDAFCQRLKLGSIYIVSVFRSGEAVPRRGHSWHHTIFMGQDVLMTFEELRV